MINSTYLIFGVILQRNPILFFEFLRLSMYINLCTTMFRGAGAGPAGTAAAGPMLEAKLMNLIKGQLQKFWLSNNFSVKLTRSHTPAALLDQSWYASDATDVNMITTSDERTEGVEIYDELGTMFMYGQLLHWFSVSSY